MASWTQEMAYKDPPVLEEMVERVFVGTSPRDGKDRAFPLWGRLKGKRKNN